GAPGPNTFRRGIELHSMGRCNPVFFREFQKLVAEHDWAYIYNTVHLSTLDDYTANRKYLSDILKRTLFFEVNPAKFDGIVESKFQHEFGYRYFEGIAAGCILVGLENRNPNFEKLFPWEDVLIELPTDSEEIVPFLLNLYEQKDRLRHISRANTRGALLYHDFAYRWERTLAAAGLKPTEKLLQRREALFVEAERYA
ncbi:MAG: glycosyltransferase, partial [Verrucomicrobiae bacterium]|nr:glycosyltransferase [Verrucomicrobiae bacterium]